MGHRGQFHPPLHIWRYLRACLAWLAVAALLAGCGGWTEPVPDTPDPPDTPDTPDTPDPPDPPDPPDDPSPIQPSATAQKVTVEVEMEDGTPLSTNVHLPAGEGPWPVVLIRTPYGNDNEDDYAAEALPRGYAVVSQDMRGRYDSPGENLPHIGCGWGTNRDGYETFEWISRQWWCNGRIGTTGGSMLGMTQHLAAVTRPPGLVCQFIGVAAASMYHEFVFHGGAFREEQMLGWGEAAHWDEGMNDLYRQHPLYDDFWRSFSIREHGENINVPGMHYGGWFDTFVQGTLDGFLLRQHEGGPNARGRQWLVIGPWWHGGMGKREIGEMTFPWNAMGPPEADFDTFMDYWLADKPTGLLDVPQVTYYLMGPAGEEGAPGNYWLTCDDWPPASVESRYYLHEGGLLNWAPPESEAPSAFTFDPADPSPTIGGRNLIIKAGPYDQRSVEERGDILLYSSEPLSWPCEVTGRLSCHLWVASDTVDADVAVRLTDVYPDGRSMLIADGILRLSHRAGDENYLPLTPGQAVEIDVDLWSTAYVFAQGHRIRIDISGGNWPRWDRNPGTGGQWSEGCQYVVQHTTLYSDAQHLSWLSLPVVVEREY